MKAALFDMDGVIVDTQKYHVSIYQQIAKEEFNTILSKETIEALGGVLKEEGAYIVAKEVGLKPTKKNCDRLYEKKDIRYKEIIREKKENLLMEGSLELLQRLKDAHIKMALCSASSNANEIIKLTKIDHFFDTIVDLTNVQKGKPSPEIFLKGAIQLGVNPSECVVYEDAINGIQAAKNAGMYSIGYKINLDFDGLSYGQSGADRVVSSLSDPLCYKGLYTSLNDEPLDCKVFVFDAGNVAINNIECLSQIIKELKLSEKEANEFLLDFKAYSAPLMDGNISCDQYWKHIRDTMNIEIVGDPFYNHFCPTLNKPIIEIMKRLKDRGYRVVLGSNTFTPHAQIMGEKGLFDFTNYAYMSHEIKRYKPSSSFFKYIIEKENIDASHIYFIDDLSKNIASAAKEGLKTFHYVDINKNERLKKAFKFIY
ncbi:MAG: HAD family hydrolase [Spirochaetaceae bacterium]|nr:HAD family hydrolase [Spirochaetaceae bacterium]